MRETVGGVEGCVCGVGVALGEEEDAVEGTAEVMRKRKIREVEGVG